MSVDELDISILVGRTISKIDVVDNRGIVFTLDDSSVYEVFHEQDCCEVVTIDDINGELGNLVGSPILMAESAASFDGPPKNDDGYEAARCTWTFYKLATVKGYVTIRWYGESKGYYSESVSFTKRS